MKVYVASSWRNAIQPAVVMALRMAGHEVYDFRHPAPGDDGFHWSEVDPNWKEWAGRPDAYLTGLEQLAAKRGFAKDMAGLNDADVTVLVLPCGRSAHLEAGYAAGQGKPVIILLDPTFEPELMYKLAYRCVTTVEDVVTTLAEIGMNRAAAAGRDDSFAAVASANPEMAAFWLLNGIVHDTRSRGGEPAPDYIIHARNVLRWKTVDGDLPRARHPDAEGR